MSKIIVVKNKRLKHILNKNIYLLNFARSLLTVSAAATVAAAAAAVADACCIDTFADSITCSIKVIFRIF